MVYCNKMSDHIEYCNIFNNNSEDNKFFENENVNNKGSDELLIKTVRAYPHLYDHQDRNFKDNIMKENSWKEIALAVNISASDCQNRWVRLRERFGKEKRQRELDTKIGSGAIRRSVFAYYENMAYTNVSNLKSLKTIERKKLHSSTILPSTIQKEKEEVSLSTISPIIENMELSISKTVAQPSNIEAKVSIQSCANFLKPFNKSFLSDTNPDLSTKSLENNNSISSDSLEDFPISSFNLNKSDELTRNSMFSMRELSPSAKTSPKIMQTTPLRRALLKKNNFVELETSVRLLCQTMHQHLQDNRNSERTGNSDETFARLVVHQLETLPWNEKQKRQQRIMQILYEPFDIS